MRPSNLQLRCYFVTDLTVTANQAFDPAKEVNVLLDDLLTEPECLVKGDDEREWQISLRVSHTPNPENNVPYSFSIELVGFFGIERVVPEEKVEQFAFVNGASVLFSTAREVLRSVMTNGPYDPILLPTVCFLDAKPEATIPNTPSAPVSD
ncbi:MAG: protein-export chaperone SecB [Lentisphaerae bacterium]|nr:protein-export chaperone SecB [Lentisphaerota bacterium]